MSEDQRASLQPEPQGAISFPWRTLVHLLVFGLLLALAIFLAKGPPSASEAARRVLFTAADVAQVKARFEKTWMRPPTAVELRRAFEQYARDEVLFREALARGLDRGDPIVRLTMVRKITMLGSAAADLVQPTDEEILAYFTLRQERYRIPGVASLWQVCLGSDQDGEEANARTEQLLASLRAADPHPDELAELGESLMIPSVCKNMTEQELDGQFGTGFGAAVLALTPDRWEGPITSGFGQHLVKVTALEPSRIPDWTEVRTRIESDMQFEGRKAAEDQFFTEILPRYQVMYDDAAAAALDESTL